MPESGVTRLFSGSRGFDWVDGLVALVAILGIIAFGFFTASGNKEAATFSIALGGAPVVLFVLVSLAVLGMAAPFRPIIRRDSLLWAWVGFLSKGASSGIALVVGALVGGLLGVLMSDAKTTWAGVGTFASTGICGWLALVVVVWTVRASVDVGRLGKRREALLRTWLKRSNVRKPRRVARVVASGADVMSVIWAGCLMLLAVAEAYSITAQAMAVGA